jgi:hypothetical protein
MLIERKRPKLKFLAESRTCQRCGEQQIDRRKTRHYHTHHVADIYLWTGCQPTGDSQCLPQYLQIMPATNQRRFATTSIADLRCPTRARRPLQVYLWRQEEGRELNRCRYKRFRRLRRHTTKARLPRMVSTKGESARRMGQDTVRGQGIRYGIRGQGSGTYRK